MPRLPNGRYTQFDTTADMGIDVVSDTIEHLFETTAYAMFDLMIDSSALNPDTHLEVNLESRSLEDLLIDWLNELIFLSETRCVACVRFQVDLNGFRLRALVEAVSVIPGSMNRIGMIKAATYHGLEIAISDNMLFLHVLFDV